MKEYSVEELTEMLNGTLYGETRHLINGAEQINYAQQGHITFIGNNSYIPLWKSSKATAVLVDEKTEISNLKDRVIIRVKDVETAMAKILDLFTPDPPVWVDVIDSTAIIHKSASIGMNCKIGAHCYIGSNVSIGDNVTIYPNVSIYDHSYISSGTIIWSGTVIRERTIIGMQCIIHPNVTIGSDGFGYRPSADGRSIIKIPHIGNVIIGNNVEIGANTCIDRGKFSSTTIGDNTKIDNLCQIAHNCQIGKMCLIAAGCGISGSVIIGDGVVMAGQVGIKDHITIGNKVKIGGRAGVMNDIKDGETILGYPAINYRDTLRQWALLRKLAKNN